MTDSSLLWYASRATGIVTLLLLTVVFVIGITVIGRVRVPGLPHFAVTDLHRNLSLLAAAFLVLHVLTTVLDTYVNIPLMAAVVPFTSGYDRFWLGLGAVALDLMLAMIVTSLVRGHLNAAVWRAIHLTVYLSWPVAFLHSLYSGRDLRHGFLLDLAAGCALAIAAASAWRLARAVRRPPRAGRVAAELSAAYRKRQVRHAGQVHRRTAR